ncbi:MAG TPA: hypothetical protein VJQ47_12460 [Steroidobacteraceae bacterium]|nr:hypothetical protein [Steroidobacteraceae bacterium]
MIALPEIPVGPDSDSRLQWRRLALAFALTPLLSAFYPAIILAEPYAIPVGTIAAYGSILFLGLPLAFLFDRRYWRSWWQFAVGGVVCSLPSLITYAVIRSPPHLPSFGFLPGLGVLLWGAGSGVVFWLLGVAGDSPVTLRSLLDLGPPEK